MRLSDMSDILNQRIHKRDTWPKDNREPYGLQNTHRYNPDKVIVRILYCVTISPEIEQYAYDNHYNAIIAHHPILSDTKPNIPKFHYHLPLDNCAGGLNDQWAAMMGLQNYKHIIDNLGWYGTIKPNTVNDIVKKCEQWIGSPIVGIVSGAKDKIINTVAICTGLGGMILDDVRALSPDLFITGELFTDPNPRDTVQVIEVGHTLSEQCGVNTIRELFRGTTMSPPFIGLAPIELDKFGRTG